MITEPTQDEFDAWKIHPVSQFVALAYERAAEKQRQEWEKYFHAPVVPADLAMIRLELKTREDAYRAFLETTLEQFVALVASSVHAPHWAGAGGRSVHHGQNGQRSAQPRQDR